ncbi:MAG TPA: hypothetical protein DCS82_13870 [Rhodospirillaceae bacterium]|nr:hypothetical protein [Rhodospirillaceae bacterium]HAT36798.1 hypothetical protein [Rhodospirillaceae bacterium]
MRRLLIIFALGAFVGSASAADKQGRYLVVGDGAEGCSLWTDERKKSSPRSRALESWLLGYITATNVWRPDTADVAGGLEAPALFEWTDNYCQEHPKSRIAEAARNLIYGLDELSAQNKKKRK